MRDLVPSEDESQSSSQTQSRNVQTDLSLHIRAMGISENANVHARGLRRREYVQERERLVYGQ